MNNSERIDRILAEDEILILDLGEAQGGPEPGGETPSPGEYPKSDTDMASSLIKGAEALWNQLQRAVKIDPKYSPSRNEVNVTTLTSLFTHAQSRKTISSSRPKTSLPVTGNLAIEIFLGASLVGGLRGPTSETAGGVSCKL